jgi:hypothetical protein
MGRTNCSRPSPDGVVGSDVAGDLSAVPMPLAKRRAGTPLHTTCRNRTPAPAWLTVPELKQLSEERLSPADPARSPSDVLAGVQAVPTDLPSYQVLLPAIGPLFLLHLLDTVRVPWLDGRYPASQLLWTHPTPRTPRPMVMDSQLASAVVRRPARSLSSHILSVGTRRPFRPRRVERLLTPAASPSMLAWPNPTGWPLSG